MCGIAGIITMAGSPGYEADHYRDIRKMTLSLEHRGPDGESYWTDTAHQIWLGHRRLAIIDRTEAAAQPMHYGGRYSIVYNGELYNYLELKKELQGAGQTFNTASDTEVILAAFDHYGEDCVRYFDGMFAFAIWDAVDQYLFMARDRFGEKPLFFHQAADGRFLFASEMKALWAIGVPKIPRDDLSILFLATGMNSFPLDNSGSFYQEIHQVPPAHSLSIKLVSGHISEPVATRYWDIDTTYKATLSEAEAIDKIKELLRQSVQMRLRSDVPVGTSLSGGIDSSSIATMVAGEKGQHFKSFSAVFPGFEKDEKSLIDLASNYLQIENYQVSPNAGSLSGHFDKLLYHQEQPVSSASVLVQYQVFALAKQHGIKVLLDGQGADELLGGYENYIHWFLQEQFRSGNWNKMRREHLLFRNHGSKHGWGLGNYIAALFPQGAQHQLLAAQKREILGISNLNPAYADAHFSSEELYKPLATTLEDILYFDITMGRLPELLRYADRNSMANGCEVRLPFLQPGLVELVFSLPSHYKMRNGFTKWLLRTAMSDRLPPQVCWQTKKIGFEPPQRQWMQDPQMQERVHESRKKLVARGIMQKKLLTQPLNPMAANTRNDPDWRGLVLATLYDS